MAKALSPPELPPGLERLGELALDLFWTWSHAGDALWRRLDREVWDQTENPWIILQEISPRHLAELARDPDFQREYARVVEERDAYLSAASWYDQTHSAAALRGVAYFTMEVGLGPALPLYAGGLGILAGDYLKAASDLGVPVVGVSLLYQEGNFRQFLDAGGEQQEIYTYTDPASIPIQPVRAADGGWLNLELALPGRPLELRVWQASVGRVTLYLLDTNDPMNSPRDRGITSKLYGGGPEVRLLQEIVLGIGGWRLIEALGLEVDICHINEGHAAFAILERAHSLAHRLGLDLAEALWATRAGNVFTTHTPVDAAFDRFPPALINQYWPCLCPEASGRLSVRDLLALGRRDPGDDAEAFTPAYLALRGSAVANGVSALHGDVSRRIFLPLFPGRPEREVPVTHVTNGAHMPSWDSIWADRLWTEACGKDRWLGRTEEVTCRVEAISDEEIWAFRGRQRRDLIAAVRARLARHLGQQGAEDSTIAASGHVLDPNALTLGFARRFTEYKRPNILLHDPERFRRILRNPERPVQIVVAGKAHPDDRQGKRMVSEWARFVEDQGTAPHAVFLEDYDMALAQILVEGVDLWINAPRRPWEACGTSGMKVLVNGGLNLSALDGWWAEAYAPDVGWALGDGLIHTEPGRDAVEAEALYRLLEEEVVPDFYDRDPMGVPRRWAARVRASMARLAPRFSSNRMTRDYVERIYLASAASYRRRLDQGAQLSRELGVWQRNLEDHWDQLRFGALETREEGGAWTFRLQVYLGEIPPEAIRIELFFEADESGQGPIAMDRGDSIPGAANGFLYSARAPAERPSHHYTPRIVPNHPEARLPIEFDLVQWQR